jgi:RND family efflux transporter MFP subunit
MKKTIVKIAKWVGFVGIVFGVWKYASRDVTQTLNVREVTMEDRVVQRTVSASGEIVSDQDAKLAFKTLGRLYSLEVEKGQEVQKGALLATLENYTTAQTAQSYKDARDIVSRDRELFIENYSTNLNAYGGEDEYNLKLRIYDEQLSQAEATYQSALGSLWSTYLYTPFDGIVTEVPKVVGEAVLAGETVVRVSNLGNLVFEIGLDQEDYGFIKRGQKVEIELDAYADVTFEGTVSDLPFFTSTTSTSDFEVEIAVTPGEITPLLGMTGDAHIVVARTENEVPALMFDEIFYDEQDKPYIWVHNAPYIEKQHVETGLEGDVYTEVISVVEHPVIVGFNGNVDLKEGLKAKFPKGN